MVGESLDISVLVADDELIGREQAVALLRRMAPEVRAAPSVPGALKAFREHPPDVTLVAVRPPALAGLELAELLRRERPDAALVATCHVDDSEGLKRLVAAGFDALLLAPLEPDVLRRTLERLGRGAVLARKLRDARVSFLQLLNAYPAHALLVEDGRTAYVNKRLVDYLGFSGFDAFRGAGRSVGDFVTDVDGAPYQGEGDAWALDLVADPVDRQPVVRIANPRHPERRPGAFLAAFHAFPEPGRYLVVLSDVSDLEAERQALADDASTDPLTGALNRRRFLELVDEALALAALGRPFGLILFDIDHFKRVNDTYGHDVGDEVLRGVTAAARANLRDGDVLARWGGEEFLVLCPGVGEDGAARMAERLRAALEAEGFPGVDQGRPGAVTASFGVVACRPGEARDALVKRADLALYAAKTGGRNRVERGGGPETGP